MLNQNRQLFRLVYNPKIGKTLRMFKIKKRQNGNKKTKKTRKKKTVALTLKLYKKT